MPTLLQRTRQRLARIIGGAAAPVFVRKFAGARIDRLAADWLATETSLNEELRTDLTRLRARGRDLAKDNDYAAKFVGMCKNNIIGPGGIRLQARVEDAPGKPDRLANAAIEAAWADWGRVCDVTGRQSLRDLCETLVGSLPSDGEFLLRIVRGADAGNAYGIALQLIDVDRIDTDYNTTQGPNGHSVVMGVELNAYRRPVALHLFAAHPHDGVHTGRQRVRVPSTELLHVFKSERADQVRGYPWMAAGMLSLHHLANFKLSALLAAEHGANHFGFFQTPDGAPPLGNDDGTGTTITASQPGTYDTLPAGVSFVPHESKYPNEVFGPFVKTTLQRIASGWRVAYHSLANDLEGVSYSSIRSGALEERDRWSADQEWFIAAVMEPIYQAWLQTALLSGAITMPNGSPLPAAKAAKFARHDWQPRRWEWVDPKGDMEAKILAVKAGLMAPQDLAAAMGYDFDDTLTAIAAAQNAAAALGVQLTAYDPTPGAQSAAAANAATATATAPARELELLRQLQEQRSQPATLVQVDVTSAAMERAILQAAEPIVRQFADTAHSLLERDMPIIINVPEQAAPVVHVAAPVVNIAPASITVEATVPEATVVVNGPRSSTQKVERAADGEILQTVTTHSY